MTVYCPLCGRTLAAKCPPELVRECGCGAVWRVRLYFNPEDRASEARFDRH